MENSSDHQSSSTTKKSVETAVADEDFNNYSSSSEDEDEETRDPNEGGLFDKEDGFDDSFNDEDETEVDNDGALNNGILKNICRSVNRTRNFIKIMRRSCHLRDYVKQEAKLKKLEGEGLILDCIIRWNSTFYMVDRFIKYQDVVNQMTVNPRLTSASLSLMDVLKRFIFHHDVWDHLIALRDALSKFEEACCLISGKKYQTLSIAFMVLIGLEHHLSQSTATCSQNSIESTLKQSLYEAYRYHVHDKISSNQRRAMMVRNLIYCNSSLKF